MNTRTLHPAAPRALLAIALLTASLPASMPAKAFDLSRLIMAGAKALSAATISNSQIINYVGQYVADLDSKNTVLDASSPYSQRLARITAGITQVNGIPLNFKVYKTKDINAFACADGSVRVYSGLMDVMTDDEVLAVIGHEIGHVAHEDSKRAFKQALLSSAIADGIASNGGMATVLTDSQLGQLGQALLSKGYSRKQESQADDYGYDFLKRNGKNPWAMAMAFEQLKATEHSAGQSSSMVSNILSDHPDLDTRIAAMSKRATKDGYKRPATN